MVNLRIFGKCFCGLGTSKKVSVLAILVKFSNQELDLL